MASGSEQKIFRFGAYEVDAASGEMRKSGLRLRLQDQPFQVLVILLTRSGEIVSRDELRQNLWPADTFVDFDHSLNTIIRKLRDVLGDSASNPRFIETVAKRGYRFLASVELASTKRPTVDTRQIVVASTLDSPASPEETKTKSLSLLTSSDDLPPATGGYVRVFFLLIQIMYLCFYITALANLPQAEVAIQRDFAGPPWLIIVVIVSAAIGIPVRLYFFSTISFKVKDLSQRFLRIFPATFLLDELWSLGPFLLSHQIGLGLALAATAALIYVPFAQRTLLLMADRTNQAEYKH